MKAMIGPWSHDWPSSGFPDVAVEWRHEAVRWFDLWLKGRDTGIMEEPQLAVYVRDYHPPGTRVEHIPGRWRWEDGWPIARTRNWTLYPNDDRALAAKPGPAQVQRLPYQATTGVEAGGPVMWYGDLGWDQRAADAMSLVYDTPELERDVEILGFVHAHPGNDADAPLAYWLVRLSDVAPDGRVTQVAAAGYNAAQRESASATSALQPGRVYPIDVELHLTSWVFPKGHRIRLAVNNAQWPMIWPTKYPTTTSLKVGGQDGAHVLLPVVPPGERPAPNFLPPAEDPKMPGFETLDRGTTSGYGEITTVDRNPQTGEVKVLATNSGERQLSLGHAELPRDDRAPHVGFASRKDRGHRHPSAGNGARGPAAALGGEPLVHQRSRQLLLQVYAPPVGERHEAARENLDGDDTPRLPVIRRDWFSKSFSVFPIGRRTLRMAVAMKL